MRDKGFQILVAIAVAVLVVVMSTPVTAVDLHGLTARLRQKVSASQQAPAPAAGVAVARN